MRSRLHPTSEIFDLRFTKTVEAVEIPGRSKGVPGITKHGGQMESL